MTARQHPDPLHAALQARLNDWVENALDPQACAHALHRVLEVAHAAELNALRWNEQLPVPVWVATVRREAADALGLDRNEEER